MRTKEEKNKGIERIYQMLILGMRTTQIWENLVAGAAKEGTPAKSVQTFYRDLAKARALLEKDAAPQRKLALGRSKARLELLFSRSMAIQDYKAALAVTREINELLGLHEPTKLSVEEIRPIIRFVPAQKKADKI
ncbi:MAG: hypothetical protein WC081_00390 [Candidatus Ratteibacteria bacterium]